MDVHTKQQWMQFIFTKKLPNEDIKENIFSEARFLIESPKRQLWHRGRAVNLLSEDHRFSLTVRDNVLAAER